MPSITTHYSAAELSTLLEAANRVCESGRRRPELVALRRFGVACDPANFTHGDEHVAGFGVDSARIWAGDANSMSSALPKLCLATCTRNTDCREHTHTVFRR